jgi:hypothetical protein
MNNKIFKDLILPKEHHEEFLFKILMNVLGDFGLNSTPSPSTMFWFAKGCIDENYEYDDKMTHGHAVFHATRVLVTCIGTPEDKKFLDKVAEKIKSENPYNVKFIKEDVISHLRRYQFDKDTVLINVDDGSDLLYA